jgi:hypothetical protein
MLFVSIALMLGLAALILRLISGTPNRTLVIAGTLLIVAGLVLWAVM